MEKAVKMGVMGYLLGAKNANSSSLFFFSFLNNLTIFATRMSSVNWLIFLFTYTSMFVSKHLKKIGDQK